LKVFGSNTALETTPRFSGEDKNVSARGGGEVSINGEVGSVDSWLSKA